MLLFRIADRLHKSVAEIEQLSLSEIAEWLAYFQIAAGKHPLPAVDEDV